MDRQLERICRKHGCRYTRYADDITISTRTALPADLLAQPGEPAPGPAVLDIIQRNGFLPNDHKTRVRRRHQRLEVTGLIINERINVPRSYVRDIRAKLHNWRACGYDAANSRFKFPSTGRGSPELSDHIRGKLDYLAMVCGADDPLFCRYAIEHQALANELRAASLKRRPASPKVRPFGVIVQGKAAETPHFIEEATWVVVAWYDGVEFASGTAFSLDGVGVVTAKHVFDPDPNFSLPTRWELVSGRHYSRRFVIRGIREAPAHIDLAVLDVELDHHACLACCDASQIPTYSRLRVVGYPHWHTNADRVRIEPVKGIGKGAVPDLRREEQNDFDHLGICT